MTGARPALPRVLAVAGTDPTGGAGLQADLKAIAAHDGYGMGVVTALVAQNTHGVRAVHVPDTAFLRAQLDAVSDDVTVDAVKVGMLGTAAVVREVTDWLRTHRPPFVVVDPVMVASSGDRLLDEDAEDAMRDLLALADLVTPNRAELTVLARLAGGADDPDPALRVARTWGVRVLAKGGHDTGPTADDELVHPDGARRTWSAPRVATDNTHGTGCSLSSAVTTLVAAGGDWELAVGEAKAWLGRALAGADALRVGTGTGPVDHGAATRDALPVRPWTDRWWEDTADVRTATLATPFLTGLRDGTLPRGVFAAYLAQDVHYLRAYERHLRTLADRTTGDARAAWDAAARGCADEVRALHGPRLAGTRSDDPVHPVCAGYLAHLQAAADTGSVAVLAAAVLPCFRVYAWVGTQLGTVADDHPYADWVRAYADPGFAAATVTATQLVERAAVAAGPVERGAMARAVRASTRWEEAFFRMPTEAAGG